MGKELKYYWSPWSWDVQAFDPECNLLVEEEDNSALDLLDKVRLADPECQLPVEGDDNYLQNLMDELRLASALEDLDKYCLCFEEKCFHLLQACQEACLDILQHPSGIRDLPRRSPSSDLTIVLDNLDSSILQIDRRKPSSPYYMRNLQEQKEKLSNRRKEVSAALYYGLSYPPPPALVQFPKASNCPPFPTESGNRTIWGTLASMTKDIGKGLKSRLQCRGRIATSLLEDSLRELEDYCICFQEDCWKLLEHSLLQIETVLRGFGKDIKFQKTGNPTLDFVQVLSNYNDALELVINWEGTISKRLGKLGARCGKLRKKHQVGHSTLRHFWKEAGTQDLQVFNIHFVKNKLI
jgi:hypothetical protein